MAGEVGATVDHVFMCCSVGGPEADSLTLLGLKEGAPNTHPRARGPAVGGSSSQNAYFELLWVSDPMDAQAEAMLSTRLWERWSKRGPAACPYGIVLGPAVGDVDPEPPFESWSYRLPYMPPTISIEVARDILLTEPALFYLGVQRDRARAGQEPVEHNLPVRSLTGITVWRPAGPGSEAVSALEAAGVMALRDADEYLMELSFDDANRGGRADLRPAIPSTLRW